MSSNASRDDGFTLVEVLIAVVMMGLIAAVLAAAFTVIARTTPATETRIDDATTGQGLTTYLPEDVNSTPSSGFSFAKTDGSGCAGSTDPGVSLLRLSWTELADSFVANYRYEPNGSGDAFRIVRYYCVNGAAAFRANLTSDLPAIELSTWTAGSSPVVVTPALDGADTIGVTMEVTTIAGEQVKFEARTNNPDETLPPQPGGPAGGGAGGSNTPPVASPISATIVATGSSDVSLDVVDADLDPLVGSSSNVVSAIPGWTVTISGLIATITPPPGAADGDTMTFDFVGNDGQEDSNTALATITIGVPNSPPIATDQSAMVDELTNALVAVPISDADGDALAVSIVSSDPSLSVTVDSVSASEVVFDVLASGSVTSPTFTYRVGDGTASDDGVVSLTVNKCVVSAVTPAAQSVERQTSDVTRLATSVTFTVSSTGPCAGRLSLAYVSDLSITPAPTPSNLFFNPSGTASFSAGHGDWIRPSGQPTHPDHTWTLAAYLDGVTIVDTVQLTVQGKKSK